MQQSDTLIALLQQRAAERPAQILYTSADAGSSAASQVTYAEMEQQARAIAVALHGLGARGERAVLLIPPGPALVAAFFGCLYAGAVAVPVADALPQHLPFRAQMIAADAQASIILTTSATRAALQRQMADLPDLAGCRWVATDALPLGDAIHWQRPEVSGKSLALIQYRSGAPPPLAGVALSHANLLHGLGLLQARIGATSATRGVFCLPFSHDMGLIGGLLGTVAWGGSSALIASPEVLQRPLIWLQAITRYQASVSGAPNHIYDRCVYDLRVGDREALDLRCWDVALNGGAPIEQATIERFAAAFAGCGFRRQSFYCWYGLTEATLMVAGGSAGAAAGPACGSPPPGSPTCQPPVSAGAPDPSLHVSIVDPRTLGACPPGQVGEIWLRGPGVAQGYWNRPRETRRTFDARLAGSGAGPFLRTGDLGFMHGGQLFVTGRIKDLLVCEGRSIYPQDIERAAEASHPALRPGCGAAFVIEVLGEEQLVLVQEVERLSDGLEVEEIAGAVRRAVMHQHALPVFEIVLLRPGSLPRTSSGKIQRHVCRAALLAGRLSIIGDSVQERDLVSPAHW